MYEFKNKSETVFAPLSNELFNFPFVKEVFMNTNYISITKKNNYNWQEFSNELREFIRNYIENNKTIIPTTAINSHDKIYFKATHSKLMTQTHIWPEEDYFNNTYLLLSLSRNSFPVLK